MAGFTPGREEAETPEPRRLRQLRQLVTLLTATLIAGVIIVVALLVIRLAAFQPDAPPGLPPGVALPVGETARAVTFGTGWIAVVTADPAGAERVRIYDAATGAARGAITIAPGPSGPIVDSDDSIPD